jgi:Protein of unknown function (DUF3047)
MARANKASSESAPVSRRTRGAGLVGAALLVMLAACASPDGLPERGAVDPSGLLGTLPKECVTAWHPQSLPGKRATRYDAVAEDGRPIVLARADRSASLVRHRLRIEPAALGRLRFSWRVSELIAGADMRDREASDSPARLVLAFEGDAQRLGERERLLFDLAETLGGERPPFATLMYVWDAHAPVDTVLVSGRSSRVRKIVVESGPEQLDRWRLHERDIAADFSKAYGEAPGALVGVALMTDADNTAGRAQASYGPVCFPGVKLATHGR